MEKILGVIFHIIFCIESFFFRAKSIGTIQHCFQLTDFSYNLYQCGCCSVKEDQCLLVFYRPFRYFEFSSILSNFNSDEGNLVLFLQEAP